MTKHVDGFKTLGEIIAESPMIRDRLGLPNHNLTHFWSTDGIECLWCGAVRTADQIAEWDRAGGTECMIARRQPIPRRRSKPRRTSVNMHWLPRAQ